jgi:hypothetical protein
MKMIWRSEPDSMMEIEYGDFYKIDCRYNFIMDWRIDIQELAKELDVLDEYERIGMGYQVTDA